MQHLFGVNEAKPGVETDFAGKQRSKACEDGTKGKLNDLALRHLLGSSDWPFRDHQPITDH